MPTATASRLYFLDWVRILAFALLVLFHVGMYYVSWDWHVKSPHASAALEPWMRLSSPWRLTLLFLVSGAATAFLFARLGVDGARLGPRARRLLLPLLAGMLVIVPPQSYFEVVQRYGFDGGYLDFLRLYFSAYGGFCKAEGECLILPTWNHLWFLPYLFVYTALLWLLMRARPGAFDAMAGRLPQLLAGARLLWLPVLFFAATRLALHPHFPVTHALVGDWFAHTQFGAAFFCGAALAKAPALWPRMERLRWLALALALFAWAALLAPAPVPMPWWRPLAYSIVQWCAIVAVLGFARRHLNRDGPLRRYLTDAVFPVYILHQTLIVLLAQALVPATLGPAVEGPLLVTGTFALSVLGFELVRRSRWLRPWFGMASGSQRSTAPSLRSEKRVLLDKQ